MIARLIDGSIHHRLLVLLLAVLLTGWGVYAVKETPVDAIPDLSDVQVIIRTSYPGQAPKVVEDQVTYPLTTAMLSVPKAVNVRGYSFFGDSYVYVIFQDGTDPYWARSRVLEYLNQVAGKLPPEARLELGPDATGVGWVYEYALVDRSGRHDLAQLRSLQDWFLKYELKTVSGVSEVATVGGMVKQYQVVLDPDRLRAYKLSLERVRKAIVDGNQEVGGSVIELAEAEYMLRATGYVNELDDLRHIPLGVNERGVPILLQDVAEIRFGPQMRRGIAELDGEGEVVGGIIVMRYGENALKTIEGVKAKLAELRRSLPARCRDRRDLRPLGAHRARRRHAQAPAGRGVRGGRAGLRDIPVSPAFRAGHRHLPAARHTHRLHRHGAPGHQCQHHVARRHRDRHRSHGRCGHRHDRERAQAPGEGSRHTRQSLGDHAPGIEGGGAAAVLFAAHHHAEFPAGVHPAGPGGAPVRAARLYQDLRHGGGRGPFGHAGAGAHGLFHSRSHHPGGAQSR